MGFMPMLTTSISLPLYIQISELLEREIAAGHYRVGDRLPPEAQLAKNLGVAVGTLRKALLELETRGRLLRKQGSGTYVANNNESLVPTKSIYEFFRLELVRGGGLPTAVVIDFQKVSTPQYFEGNSYRVRRLRSLNSIPIAIEEIYFSAEHRSDLKVEDLGEALYWFYQKHLGFWIANAEDHIGLAAVPSWSPSLFAPVIGSLSPYIERISTSNKNQIEEYSMTWFDAKVARYINRMK